MQIDTKDLTEGEIVKKIRKITNLNQEQFGKKINRGRDSIAKIETNKQEMGLSKFLEMLKINGFNMIIFKEDNNA